jgi:cytochrome c6
VRGSVALVPLAIALAGCGGSSTPPAATSSSSASTGKELFVQQCGACHTLADAGAKGIVGTNLDEHPPTKSAVLEAIRTGPKNMPADLVAGANADRVADYVASVAGT